MKKSKKQSKKRILSILLLVLCVWSCTSCGERQKDQMTYRQKGITLMENGKYEEALEEFQNALDLSLGEIGDTEVDICFYKAEAQYQLGDVEGAMHTYTAIIDYNKSAKAYFLRGNLYYSLSDEEKALSDYASALEQDKKDYDLYIGVYEALCAHGKDKEAQDYLNQALQIGGNTAYDKMQKGRINFLLGETETAVSLLEDAIKGKKEEAYYYMAEIQQALGNEEEAQTNIEQYVACDDVDSYNLFHVANDQLAKGNCEMAIRCLDQALGLENVPNRQMILKTRIIAYEQKRDFATAKELMAEYIAAYPEDETALRENTFLETR